MNMTVKAEIKKKIDKLNSKCSSLRFEFVSEDGYCEIVNHSTRNGSNSSFGVYYYSTVDKDDLDIENAYRECNAFLTGLLAGTTLLDEKAYHNFIARI